VAFGWLDAFQQDQVENLIDIWGDSTILRALYPEGPPAILGGGSKGFDDPVWDRSWEKLREGRAEYPDSTPGHIRSGEKGRKHLFKLVHLLMAQIAEEAGMFLLAR